MTDYASIPRPPMLTLTTGTWPAHASLGPIMARRIACLLDALIDLEADEPTRKESPLHAVAINGAIALYAQELIEPFSDSTVGLVGWVQNVDEDAWTFAGYVRQSDASGASAVQP